MGNGWKNPGPSNKLLYARCNKRAANGPGYRYYERDDNFDCRTLDERNKREEAFSIRIILISEGITSNLSVR